MDMNLIPKELYALELGEYELPFAAMLQWLSDKTYRSVPGDTANLNISNRLPSGMSPRTLMNLYHVINKDKLRSFIKILDNSQKAEILAWIGGYEILATMSLPKDIQAFVDSAMRTVQKTNPDARSILELCRSQKIQLQALQKHRHEDISFRKNIEPWFQTSWETSKNFVVYWLQRISSGISRKNKRPVQVSYFYTSDVLHYAPQLHELSWDDEPLILLRQSSSSNQPLYRQFFPMHVRRNV